MNRILVLLTIPVIVLIFVFGSTSVSSMVERAKEIEQQNAEATESLKALEEQVKSYQALKAQGGQQR